MISALCFAVAVASSDGPATQCGPVTIEGVAFTHGQEPSFSIAARAKGTLPRGGIWTLNVLEVQESDGERLPTKQKLVGGLDIQQASNPVELVSSLDHREIPEAVQIKGELVHCFSVEEDAVFPEVTLETRDKRDAENERHPAMRNWFVPDKQLVGTRTPLGLGLRYRQMGGWGYSGPGYDDLSFLPVEVVPETLDQGVRDLLVRADSKSVERVDAEQGPDSWRPIFQKVGPSYGGTFGFQDKEFQKVVSLKLRVRRLIADKRYPFTLQAQVQRDKDLYEGYKANPDPAKKVAWPGDPVSRATKPGSP